jgi:ribosomal silencing factor RsfS
MKNKFIFLALFLTFKIFSLDVNRSGEIILGGEVSGSGDVVRINVSNVTLNLSGNSVTDGTCGILIKPGLSNIVIRNGTIKNNNIGISIGQNCTNITIKDLNITNCSQRGIEVLGTVGNIVNTLLLSNITIENCSNGPLADDIVHIDYTQDLAIKDLFINKSGVNTRDIKAFNIFNSTKAIIENVSIIGNRGQTFEGFHIEDSTDIFLNVSNVRVNQAINALKGILYTGGAETVSNICRACVVADNKSTNGPLSGYEVQASVERIFFEFCLASNNLTTGAVSTAHCYGFNFDQCLNCSVIKCNALYNRATGNGTSNIAAGFNIGTSASGTTGVKNCEFIENQAHRNNGFIDARSFGFRVVSNLNGNRNNLFKGNIASRNGPSTPLIYTQIVQSSGTGSSQGGVPTGSVRERNISNLNTQQEVFSNVSII